MGMYGHLKGQLTELPADVRYEEEGGTEFQKAIDAAKAEYQDLTLDAMGTTYKKLKAEKEAAAKVLSKVNAKLGAVEQLMLKQMEVQGNMTSFKLAGVGNFIVMEQPHTVVVDKHANRQWFIDKGQMEMLSVQWQTLNAKVKGILLAPIDQETGQPKELPAGIDVHMRSSIQLRKK